MSLLAPSLSFGLIDRDLSIYLPARTLDIPTVPAVLETLNRRIKDPEATKTE